MGARPAGRPGAPVRPGPPGRGAVPPGAAGFVTVQFVAAVALSLVLLVMVTNVLVLSYARGVVRAALDEGVRAGARAPASERECEDRAAAVLDDLLGGAMRSEVGAVVCVDDGEQVHAQVRATFRAWLPVLPHWQIDTRAVAIKEVLP